MQPYWKYKKQQDKRNEAFEKASQDQRVIDIQNEIDKLEKQKRKLLVELMGQYLKD